LGIEVSLASVEDTVLSKLRWSELAGGLAQQQSDVREILRSQKGRLDVDYLHRQAKHMGLTKALTEILERTDGDS
jgi:hypothetical protein